MSLTTNTTVFDIFREAGEQIDADNVYLKVSSVAGGPSGNVNVTNGSGASAVNIQDGGNSITVDGTVAATQSGTWNITNISGTVSLPTGAATEATLATLPLSQASTTSGQKGTLSQGAVTTAAPTYTTGQTNPLSLTTAGALRIDGSATTQPVSGTVAATQSGTWTVQPGNTANTTAWLVTGTGGTFPITDSGGSITVDNGGTFAVQATVAAAATNIAKAEDSASADADVGVPAMAIRKATPANTSGTDGDYEMLQMSAGRLWVDPSGVTLTVGTHAVTIASGGVASGAIASGAVASGAFASGSISAGAVAAGASSFVKLEDVASADADAGVPAMAVRKATPANTSGSDGDYEMLQMSAGRLWASATVDNASGASAVNIQDGGNSITVDGTVTATPTGTYTTKETRSSTGTQTSVSGSASNVTLLASNANRLGATITNDSTAALYVKYGATASTTSYAVKLFQTDYLEIPFNYTGIIDGIWDSATGSARVTELT